MFSIFRFYVLRKLSIRLIWLSFVVICYGFIRLSNGQQNSYIEINWLKDRTLSRLLFQRLMNCWRNIWKHTFILERAGTRNDFGSTLVNIFSSSRTFTDLLSVITSTSHSLLFSTSKFPKVQQFISDSFRSRWLGVACEL